MLWDLAVWYPRLARETVRSSDAARRLIRQPGFRAGAAAQAPRVVAEVLEGIVPRYRRSKSPAIELWSPYGLRSAARLRFARRERSRREAAAQCAYAARRACQLHMAEREGVRPLASREGCGQEEGAITPRASRCSTASHAGRDKRQCCTQRRSGRNARGARRRTNAGRKPTCFSARGLWDAIGFEFPHGMATMPRGILRRNSERWPTPRTIRNERC